MSLLKNKKVLLYLSIYSILIFLSGIFVGELCFDGRGKHGKAYDVQHRSQAVQKLSKELALSVDQEVKVKAIINQHRVSIKEVRKELKTTFKNLQDQKVSEINEILTPDQQEKFNEIRKKYKHKKDRRHKGKHR